MYYTYATHITELLTTHGFPVAMVLILAYIVYKQHKHMAAAINKNTEAFHALNTSVKILSERVKPV
jgi:hypothetical protein